MDYVIVKSVKILKLIFYEEGIQKNLAFVKKGDYVIELVS